jgi:hypothetical protein
MMRGDVEVDSGYSYDVIDMYSHLGSFRSLSAAERGHLHTLMYKIVANSRSGACLATQQCFV